MRKIIIKYIFLSLALCLTLTNSSCNKWLGVSPKTEMKAEDLFSNETGFRDALIGVYSLMSLKQAYGQQLTYGYLDILGQYYDSPLKNTSSGYEHNYKHAANYNYTQKGEEGRIAGIWSNSYNIIANINLALQYIDKNRGVFTNETIYSIYKGEFLALRAFVHFDILRLFASSPKMNDGNGANSLAIPYIDVYTNTPQPQLTVKEVLAKIETDLKAAKLLMKGKDYFGVKDSGVDINKLPESMLNRRFKMNAMAVTALLSRVYLYAGNNTAALSEAKEIIGEPEGVNPTTLELASSAASVANPLFLTELIFSIDVPTLKDWTENHFLESLGTTGNILTVSLKGKNNIYDSKDLDSEFRASWLTVSSSANALILTKYNNMKYIPMLKISELYLIAAETSTPDIGLKYLNKLRSHRGLGPITTTAELETNIYKEYRREFLGDGQIFFFYKRNNYEVIGAEDNIALKDKSKAYILPIPSVEQDFGNIKK